MINQLIGIIGKEAALFESFLDLLQQQKQMLVTNDLEGLRVVTDKQREKLVESRLLNRQREELIAQIKAANSLDGDVTITRLLSLLDEGQANQLRTLRETIQNLNEQIIQTRNSNAMLVNRSREFISRIMIMLSQMHTADTGYGRGAETTDQPAAVAVDRRA
ncbi:MAG: flagellar protein FlgN [Candidatus Zixiibacteriota bacterium]